MTTEHQAALHLIDIMLSAEKRSARHTALLVGLHTGLLISLHDPAFAKEMANQIEGKLGESEDHEELHDNVVTMVEGAKQIARNGADE